MLSAHNLFHVEYICDRVAIMKNGELHICDTMESIRERFGKREYKVTFRADTDLDYEVQGDNYVFKAYDVSQIARILQDIAEKNWALIDLSVYQSALEEMYVEMIDDSSGH